MTNAQLKADIDSAITNETTPASITPTSVGVTLKSMVDYVDQNTLKIFVTQSGVSNPIIDTTCINTTGKTWTITRIGVGYYKLIPNTAFSDIKKVFVNIQNQGGYYVINAVGLDYNFIQIIVYDPETNAPIDYIDSSVITVEILN